MGRMSRPAFKLTDSAKITLLAGGENPLVHVRSTEGLAIPGTGRRYPTPHRYSLLYDHSSLNTLLSKPATDCLAA